MGKQWKQWQTLFWGDPNGDGQGSLACCNSWGHKESDTPEWLNWTELKITADGDCSYEIKRRLLLGRKAMTNLDSIFKSSDITLPTNIRLVKAMVFPVSHVWMWELDCEESWVLKNWCFWTVVLEKTLESPLDCKEIQPVYSTRDQPWVLFGRTDAKAETPVFCPPHAKS